MPEIQTAEVLNQDGPTTQDNAEALTNANPEGGEVDPQANANEGDAHKRLGGWQRKIKKLQEQNETLLELLRSGGGKTAETKQETPAEDKPPVKPNIKDFEGADAWEKYESAKDKYFEDLADYKAKQAVATFRNESQQKSEQQKVVDAWAEQIAEAETDSSMPGFREIAFNEDVPMSEAVMHAIVTSEVGAKIAYELGKNPDEAERISKLPAVQAIREIGKIESRIAGQKPAADEKEDKEEEDKEEEPPAASTKAPKPPNPVRRASGADSTALDDNIPYKEWLRRREAQIKGK